MYGHLHGDRSFSTDEDSTIAGRPLGSSNISPCIHTVRMQILLDPPKTVMVLGEAGSGSPGYAQQGCTYHEFRNGVEEE